MDRVIVYPGQIPLDTDILKSEKNTLIGLSKLAHALLGDGPWLKGLGCVPTAPASLQVQVNPGQIYQLANLDATAYGSLAADTTHQLLKQGVLLDAVTLSCPAPGTAGQSINYLIEVGYLDTDGGSTVLPYYNSSNPAQAYNGPNNSGTSQNTVRQGQCSVQVKAGTAAATGTQQTPAPDAGYIGAWVVTVANGQTTITAGNIAIYSGAPFLAPAAANGATSISANLTLTAAHSGIHGLLSGTTVVTLWTPVGNDKTRAKFTGTDGNVQTISTPAGVIYLPDGTSGTSVTVTNQDTVEMVSDGANWRIVSMTGYVVMKTTSPNIVPSGVYFPFGGSSAPAGYLMCDGASYSRSAYPTLFTAIGTTYGAVDGNSFNVPDMRDRVPIGAGTGSTTEAVTNSSTNGFVVAANNKKWITGMPVVLSNLSGFTTSATAGPTYYAVRISSTNVRLATTLALAQNGTPDVTISGTGTATLTSALTTRTLGEVGGEEAHAMSSTELLAHTHIQGTAPSSGTTYTYSTPALTDVPPGGSAVSSKGGNAAMNIMQPFLVGNYIIKT